jgi:bifunctional DNA-binding transcriptional regulator/antitoxin component of YhaV-PrlF toxin-antitoxin module
VKEECVLAKKTTKNQITLPKMVIARFTDVEHFDVTTDGESIILRPLRPSRADEVRNRLADLGIDQHDVSGAIAWARKSA